VIVSLSERCQARGYATPNIWAHLIFELSFTYQFHKIFDHIKWELYQDKNKICYENQQ